MLIAHVTSVKGNLLAYLLSQMNRVAHFHATPLFVR